MPITPQEINYLIGPICEKLLKCFNENDENYPYCAFINFSGYKLFCAAYSNQVRRQLEHEFQDTRVLRNNDITRKLYEMWNLIGDEGKDLWNTKARQLKQPNP